MLSIPASPPGQTTAIVVNWNGWRDTIACIESLLALEGARFRVVVCDNGSSDGSVLHLASWLARRLPQWRTGDDHNLASPEAREGVQSIHLLPLDGNLGYAGGINAGITWARAQWSPAGYWLLNNDVHVKAGALDALVQASTQVPGAGVCGSVLLEWEPPHQVQAVAGRFRRWLGVGWHDRHLPVDGSDFSTDLDYPVGASMYVSAAYVERVGLMDAGYFLYCEEMDWVESGRRAGLRPVVALRSQLRHKEGASTGSGAGVRNKSMVSERYGVTSRLRITRKFWPARLPVVWLSLLAVVADRVAHGEFARAALVARLMVSPRFWRT